MRTDDRQFYQARKPHALREGIREEIYPVLMAVAAAAAAAGTGLSIAGQAESQNAISRARNAELLRQQQYQKTASGVFNTSLEQSAPKSAKAQLDAGAADRQAEMAKLAQQPGVAPSARDKGTLTATSPGADGAAARTEANVTATNNAWSNIVGQAQAKLGGYQDWDVAQGIKNARANQRLALVGNEAAGSANVLPIELEVASHKGDSLEGWGQLVSALGMVAGAGAGAAGAAGTAGTTAAGGVATEAGANSMEAAQLARNAWSTIGAVPYY